MDNPRGCLLPTASGDPQQSITDFYSVLDRFDCRPTHVSLSGWSASGCICGAPARAGPDLRRRGLDAEPDRDLARARARRDHARGLGVGVLWLARAPERCAGSSRDHVVDRRAATGRRGSASARDSVRPLCARSATADLPSGRSRGGVARGLRHRRRRRAPLRGHTACEAFAGRHGARVVRVKPGPDGVREMALRPVPLRRELAPVDDPAIAEMRELRRAKAKAHFVRN